MNNIYLLLRNNKQTGPFSIEELVQGGLQPHDLVWEEGKSSCWLYPSEITSLKPYVSHTISAPGKNAKEADAPAQQIDKAYQPSQNTSIPPLKPAVPKNVYVSMPQPAGAKPAAAPKAASLQEPSTAYDLEQKAEELRRRALAATPESKATTAPESIQTKYKRELSEVENDYTSWVFKKKSQNKTRFNEKHGAAALLMIILIIVAGFGITRYDSSEKEEETIPLTVTDSSTQLQMEVPAEEDLSGQEPTVLPAMTTNNNGEEKIPEEKIPEEKILEKGKILKAPGQTESKDPVGASKEPPQKKAVKLPRKEEVAIALPSGKAIEVNKEVAEQPQGIAKDIPEEKKETEVVNPSPQKKKTFVDKLDNLFGIKRKKAEEKPAVTEKPVQEADNKAPDPVHDERKSRRRNDEVSPGSPAGNIAGLVDITSNESPEKWMLGVHGVKLTVRNRSTEVVKTASIEVSYYNDQKELLEKKMVNCKNVPPESSVTVPVPDHRLADHTDYRLVSVK